MNAIGLPGGVRVYLDEFGGLDAVGGVCAVRDHGLWEEELQTIGQWRVNTLFVSTLQCSARGRRGLTQFIMIHVWLVEFVCVGVVEEVDTSFLLHCCKISYSTG